LDAQVFLCVGQPFHVGAKRFDGSLGHFNFVLFFLLKSLALILLDDQYFFKLGHPSLQGRDHCSR
jgi:hypothetical protein